MQRSSRLAALGLRAGSALRASPVAAAPATRQYMTHIQRQDLVKAQLGDKLKAAELEGLSAEKVTEILKMDSSTELQDAAGVAKQVNDLQLDVEEIYYNAPTGMLYDLAMRHEKGSAILSTGALAVKSGKKTGRSPTEKRMVLEESTKDHIWWGAVNMPLEEKSFLINRERAVNYLNTRDRLFVVDAWVGWEKDFRLPIRIICTRAYHALFMQNMLVPATEEELKDFATGKVKPFTIMNAGVFPANRQTDGLTSSTSVAVSFERNEMVILGTQYAGEMKKGCFTVMNYYMPLRPKPDLPAGDRALPLHASANIGVDNDVSIFFGLSGTGKTTLSADPNRKLIGDDEHVWHNNGVFNMEGGCYAKCVNLRRETEPEIYDAIRFGAVLENVVWDEHTWVVDYDDISLTENTRCSYPLQFIPNAQIPAAVPQHPKNVILLTCDAFGILPPISKLTSDQVMYQFINGYTAKVAGTEMGIIEPVATFSSCFGAPFLVWHPFVYAEMLAARLDKHGAKAYLVNSGWVGGPYGTGNRCSLKYTRQLIDAIHDGTLDAMPDSEWDEMPVFGLMQPKKQVKDVPVHLLRPKEAWVQAGRTEEEFITSATSLAQRFKKNFADYEEKCSQAVKDAGPKV